MRESLPFIDRGKGSSASMFHERRNEGGGFGGKKGKNHPTGKGLCSEARRGHYLLQKREGALGTFVRKQNVLMGHL